MGHGGNQHFWSGKIERTLPLQAKSINYFYLTYQKTYDDCRKKFSTSNKTPNNREIISPVCTPHGRVKVYEDNLTLVF